MFLEVQKFSPWIFLGASAFIVVIAAIVSSLAPDGARLLTMMKASSPILLIALIYQFLKLRTVIVDGKLSIRLAPFGGTTISLDTIVSAKAVRYNPLRDFGGWGIRMGTRGWIYNARGDWAVELQVKDQGTIFVGSQIPEKLAAIVNGER